MGLTVWPFLGMQTESFLANKESDFYFWTYEKEV